MGLFGSIKNKRRINKYYKSKGLSFQEYSELVHRHSIEWKTMYSYIYPSFEKYVDDIVAGIMDYK